MNCRTVMSYPSVLAATVEAFLTIDGAVSLALTTKRKVEGQMATRRTDIARENKIKVHECWDDMRK